MTVLYLTEPGATLSATSKALVVRRRDAPRMQVPVLGVQRLVVLAPAHLTSAALALCARESVDLVVVPCGPGVLALPSRARAGASAR
jgi:CRISPR/Cas system-associated endonuclease Cas1